MLGLGRGTEAEQSNATHLFPHCTSSLAAMVCDGHVGMHACMVCRVIQWAQWTTIAVQVNGHGRGGRLVACLYDENRGVIHDQKTGNKKIIEITKP